MSNVKSREVTLAAKITAELSSALDALRLAWKQNPATVPKGLSCSENKEGQFVLVGYQAESGPWRSVYLQGAYELRNGVPSAGGTGCRGGTRAP